MELTGFEPVTPSSRKMWSGLTRPEKSLKSSCTTRDPGARHLALFWVVFGSHVVATANDVGLSCGTLLPRAVDKLPKRAGLLVGRDGLRVCSTMLADLPACADGNRPEMKASALVAKIKVKCPEGHDVYLEPWEKKACSKCGRVVIGPRAK